MWKPRDVMRTFDSPLLELARKSSCHPTSELARRRRSDCDLVASGAERRVQPSFLCGNIVQSRGVAQKDASGHAKKKHAVHHD